VCAAAALAGKDSAVKEAIGIVSEMAIEGIQPTCETFNCLVNVCAKSAGAGAGEKAVAHARVRRINLLNNQ
jgi:hypothetical protein